MQFLLLSTSLMEKASISESGKQHTVQAVGVLRHSSVPYSPSPCWNVRLFRGSSRVVLRNRSRMIMRAVVVVVGVGRGAGQCSYGGEASGAFSERANWHRQNSELIFVHCSGPFIGLCRQAPFSTGSTRRYPLALIP